MGIVRDLYYARKMSAGLKLPAPTVALLIKRLRLAAAMGGGVTKTVSGSPAHITDALAKAALSVLVSIEPIQDLHGYDHPWPAGGGVNKLDAAYSEIITQSKTFVFDAPLPVGAYTFSFQSSDTSSQVTSYQLGIYKDTTGSYVFYDVYPSSKKKTFTTSETCSKIVLYSNKAYSESVGFTTVFSGLMIESGSSATSWEPYENICPISGRTGLSVYVSPTQDPDDATTYAVDWTTQAGTVYSGTVDVVTGVLTVDRANIASYNGEVINEPWLSSMDEYAPGATPTTGAQVVYELATPLTYQLSAQEVQMLLGENYVWSSSGDTVSVTYYAEGNANPLQSLNILLGGNYSNPKTADDVSDREALEIILGGNK